MLSKTALHVIRAMVALARLPEGTYAGAGNIARATGAPPNYLAKMLKALAQEGLVHSQKGLGGGFRLARDPRAITLLDVVDAIEHLSRRFECILGYPECSATDPCALHDRWKTVRDGYLRLLRGTTIAQLVARGEGLSELAP